MKPPFFSSSSYLKIYVCLWITWFQRRMRNSPQLLIHLHLTSSSLITYTYNTWNGKQYSTAMPLQESSIEFGLTWCKILISSVYTTKCTHSACMHEQPVNCSKWNPNSVIFLYKLKCFYLFSTQCSIKARVHYEFSRPICIWLQS